MYGGSCAVATLCSPSAAVAAQESACFCILWRSSTIIDLYLQLTTSPTLMCLSPVRSCIAVLPNEKQMHRMAHVQQLSRHVDNQEHTSNLLQHLRTPLDHLILSHKHERQAVAPPTKQNSLPRPLFLPPSPAPSLYLKTPHAYENTSSGPGATSSWPLMVFRLHTMESSLLLAPTTLGRK